MLRLLDHLEEWLITFLIGAATLIIFAAVAHRYASGVAIPGLQDWLLTLNFGWAQELCIIMFVWMAKFGAAYGVRTGIHVGVDVLINRLEDRTRGKFVIFGLLAGATFTAIVGSLGAAFVWENGAHHAIFSALDKALALAGYDAINPIYRAVKSVFCCLLPGVFGNAWTATSIGGLLTLLLPHFTPDITAERADQRGGHRVLDIAAPAA
jgi:TRAP-type C4-dicarboxylate transport system permease small subunit